MNKTSFKSWLAYKINSSFSGKTKKRWISSIRDADADIIYLNGMPVKLTDADIERALVADLANKIVDVAKVKGKDVPRKWLRYVQISDVALFVVPARKYTVSYDGKRTRGIVPAMFCLTSSYDFRNGIQGKVFPRFIAKPFWQVVAR